MLSHLALKSTWVISPSGLLQIKVLNEVLFATPVQTHCPPPTIFVGSDSSESLDVKMFLLAQTWLWDELGPEGAEFGFDPPNTPEAQKNFFCHVYKAEHVVCVFPVFIGATSIFFAYNRKRHFGFREKALVWIWEAVSPSSLLPDQGWNHLRPNQ